MASILAQRARGTLALCVVLLLLKVDAGPKELQGAAALPVHGSPSSLLYSEESEVANKWHLTETLPAKVPTEVVQQLVHVFADGEDNWPQALEQHWPDCKVGPDNYRYYFLGTAPAGTKRLVIDIKKRWGTKGGPLVCLRRGGPPLPVNNTAATSLLVVAAAAGWAANSSFTGACAWFTTDAHIVLSEQHVLHGPWWLGAFTDPSDTRFQSKMIQRGPVYPFSMNVTMAGCGEGQGCDPLLKASNLASGETSQPRQEPLAAPAGRAPQSSVMEALLLGKQAAVSALEAAFDPSLLWSKLRTPAPIQVREDASEASQCFPWTTSFPLYIASATATLSITIELLPSIDTSSAPAYSAWLRWGALPVLSNSSLATPPAQSRFPSTGFTTGRLYIEGHPVRLGWWYLRLEGRDEARDGRFCIEEWSVKSTSCAERQAGSDCAWPLVQLQRMLTGPRFAALYQPATVLQQRITAGGWFSSPFNVSTAGGSSAAGVWAFFAFAVPETAAGQTLTMELRWPASTSIAERVRLYAKVGAVPTQDDFDFAARFNGSQKRTWLQGPGSTTAFRGEQTVGSVSSDGYAGLQLVVQYPMSGSWFAGLFLAPPPQLTSSGTGSDLPTGSDKCAIDVRIRSGGCPRDCSGWGSCVSYLDDGMAQPWSTCECDRTHGGVDCSVAVLSPGQQSRHVLALTLSNAAAVPAAAWAYSHQAYPEWIVFTLGGLASAVYHLCDAGGVCLAQYGTLQFADFLLSFLAVVLTCLYLAPLPPSAAAAAQLGATLLLAVLARDNATSGWSLVVVAALGALALLLGWGLEAWVQRHKRPHADPHAWGASMRQLLYGNQQRCGSLPPTPCAVLAWLSQRYRWGFVLAGLAMLGLAAAAWSFEAGPTYWMWHSLWHVAIFTCPFFLLSATTPALLVKGAAEHEYVRVQQAEGEPSDADHELHVIVEPVQVDMAGMPSAARPE